MSDVAGGALRLAAKGDGSWDDKTCIACKTALRITGMGLGPTAAREHAAAKGQQCTSQYRVCPSMPKSATRHRVSQQLYTYTRMERREKMSLSRTQSMKSSSCHPVILSRRPGCNIEAVSGYYSEGVIRWLAPSSPVQAGSWNPAPAIKAEHLTQPST